MTELTDLSATGIVAGIRAGRLTSEAAVRACLDRIEAKEPEIRAWEWLDPEKALAAARARDAEGPRGPLHGLPVGIKDIIDWEGLVTGCGSPVREGSTAARDAACVRALRAAGAVPLGKTVTTEFATFQPPRTRNPHDTARTPGGSSSGSAAAVACGMVPLALGSQTVGSVIRPAAFCGVAGLKPTRGLLSLEGVQPLAPSLDTLGAFARSLADLALWLAAVADATPAEPSPAPPRIAIARTEHWERAEPAMRAAVEDAAERLMAAGAQQAKLPGLSPALAGLADAQDVIFAAEAAEALATEHRDHRGALSEKLVAVLDRGARVAPAELAEARARAGAGREAMETVWAEVDLLLTPGAPGEAPPAADGTGDPIFNRTWTLLGGPCVTLPVGRGPAGLPLGLQLVGPPGRDAETLAAALWAEAALSPPAR